MIKFGEISLCDSGPEIYAYSLALLLLLPPLIPACFIFVYLESRNSSSLEIKLGVAAILVISFLIGATIFLTLPDCFIGEFSIVNMSICGLLSSFFPAFVIANVYFNNNLR